MAILKGSLDEEVFTKHQRVIVKAVVKISQLNEAKTSFNRACLASDMEASALRQDASYRKQISDINEYFDSEIKKILNSIKLPSRGLKQD
jgi:hypothetical protein